MRRSGGRGWEGEVKLRQGGLLPSKKSLCGGDGGRWVVCVCGDYRERFYLIQLNKDVLNFTLYNFILKFLF